jgi:hypothetical protein
MEGVDCGIANVDVRSNAQCAFRLDGIGGTYFNSSCASPIKTWGAVEILPRPRSRSLGNGLTELS